MTFKELREANVGDKVRLFGQKKRFNVMAKSDRYMIFSKPMFGESLYSIFDFEDEWLAPDNLVFGIYDYNKREDAEEALKALENGEIELSRRHGISFEEYKTRFAEET